MLRNSIPYAVKTILWVICSVVYSEFITGSATGCDYGQWLHVIFRLNIGYVSSDSVPYWPKYYDDVIIW